MKVIRTKIVATMGPACADPVVIHQLFEAGVDVCRLNFSHGSLDDHLAMLRNIHEAAARFEHPIAVLGDLCGPKIRLGAVQEVVDGGMPIAVGDELIIQRTPILGSQGRVSTTYPQFVDDVQVGDRILIEDGMLRFVCIAKASDELVCRCTMGGILKSAKGVNLPNTHVNIPSITPRDWQCVDWAIEQDLDYLALSFVRHSDELHLLREHLQQQRSNIHLIAKIEKAEAIQHIDAILEASNGLMVARGDLGVEMDPAQVPILQKELITRGRRMGKPVIVATQMLQSMIEHASPTRAEVSDVANAIMDGADAVMLSGETSVGNFPVGAVHTMAHVAEVTEAYQAKNAPLTEPEVRPIALQLSAAVSNGVWQIVRDLEAKLVVVWSQTGATARIFSKHRFPVPIVALSTDHRVLRQMSLHFGVIPWEMPMPRAMPELVQSADELIRRQRLAQPGDRIVIVAGAAMGTPGALNGLVIHTVGGK
jgi:pyruvate kinase